LGYYVQRGNTKTKRQKRRADSLKRGTEAWKKKIKLPTRGARISSLPIESLTEKTKREKFRVGIKKRAPPFTVLWGLGESEGQQNKKRVTVSFGGVCEGALRRVRGCPINKLGGAGKEKEGKKGWAGV